MVQLGLVHQSNGQTEPLSRSWNRMYLTGGFDHGELALTVRAEQRLGESNDDNPDIVRYVGNAEVVAAWVPSATAGGVLVPWDEWRAAMAEAVWTANPVPVIAIAVGVAGLLLVLVGLTARRTVVPLEAPTHEMAVTMTPGVLARLVGTRVRATDDVLSASVTASARRVRVTATAWNGGAEDLPDRVADRVSALLDELPLRRRPRVKVTVLERRGVQ